jgi:hypothetical protein
VGLKLKDLAKKLKALAQKAGKSEVQPGIVTDKGGSWWPGLRWKRKF